MGVLETELASFFLGTRRQDLKTTLELGAETGDQQKKKKNLCNRCDFIFSLQRSSIAYSYFFDHPSFVPLVFSLTLLRDLCTVPDMIITNISFMPKALIYRE